MGRQPHQAEQIDGGSRRLLATRLTRDGGRKVQQEFLCLLLKWERARFKASMLLDYIDGWKGANRGKKSKGQRRWWIIRG